MALPSQKRLLNNGAKTFFYSLVSETKKRRDPRNQQEKFSWGFKKSMPQQVTEIKEFLLKARRKDARSVLIKRNGQQFFFAHATLSPLWEVFMATSLYTWKTSIKLVTIEQELVMQHATKRPVTQLAP